MEVCQFYVFYNPETQQEQVGKVLSVEQEVVSKTVYAKVETVL